MDLVTRSIRSSIWNTVSHGLQVLIIFARSVILARLVSPEVFGVYAFVQAIVTTTIVLPSFGLGSAYIHRSPETEHPDATGVYFTLIVTFSLLWAVLLIILGWFLLEDDKFLVLFSLVVASFLTQLVTPARSMLKKQVRFQRLALLDLVVAVITTIVAITLAWRRNDVWSLVSIDLGQAAILIIGLYFIEPVWQPRLVWSSTIVRYFVRFGGTTLFAGLLSRALDRLDDMWTGWSLGDTALGFYSRAYAFANYPRRIIAEPVSAVALATYAEVKQDRQRLSKAFFRVNALIIRVGFLVSGALFLISPVFIRLILGEKWLPSLPAFRLMLVYTLIDPIKSTVSYLFLSIGQPTLLVQTRVMQLVILVIGLIILSPLYGIAGVAASATVMAVVGMGRLLWSARKYVDYSLARLFGIPVVALSVGMLASYGLEALVIDISDWQNGIIKLVTFATVYLVGILLAERDQIRGILQPVQQWLKLS